MRKKYDRWLHLLGEHEKKMAEVVCCWWPLEFALKAKKDKSRLKVILGVKLDDLGDTLLYKHDSLARAAHLLSVCLCTYIVFNHTKPFQTGPLFVISLPAECLSTLGLFLAINRGSIV